MEDGTSALNSKTLETIQKLMNLAADKAATQGEIENATRKVQEILFKYNLSMEDVDAHVKPEEIPVGEEVVDFSAVWKKSDGHWISSLYATVAKYNMCSVILRPHREGFKKVLKSIWLIGKPYNVQIVHYLCVQLVPQIRRAEKDAFQHYVGYEKRGMFRRGFLLGCVQGIKKQLYDQEKALREADQKTDAMVLVNDQAVELFVENKFPKLKDGRRSSLSGYDGQILGREKGHSIGLHPGISEGQTGAGNFGGLLGSGNK